MQCSVPDLRRDCTSTASRQWVEAEIRPVLDRYVLRVSRPHEYTLDEDMHGWTRLCNKLMPASGGSIAVYLNTGSGGR